MSRRIYDKSCDAIMKEWLAKRLRGGGTVTAEEIRDHMGTHWPKLKRSTVDCHIRKFTTNDGVRVHYDPDERSDVLFKLPTGALRLYDAGTDPKPIYAATDSRPDPVPPSPEEGGEFAYESDLRDFLASNLNLLESGLRLYEEEGGITGVEFPAGDRSIDMLAVDETGAYVVIELKVSQGHETAVGQIAYYLTWVRENLAQGKEVRGIILARKPSESLKMAARALQSVRVLSYRLSVEVGAA